MITLIEAKEYKCLRYVRQPLGNFHILVGPNASGKTAFLDVVVFLGDLLREGPEAAVMKRSRSLQELVWKGEADAFELAVEIAVPEALRKRFPEPYPFCRYEVRVGMGSQGGFSCWLSVCPGYAGPGGQRRKQAYKHSANAGESAEIAGKERLERPL